MTSNIRSLVALAVALAVLAIAPATAQAATLASPAQGAHLDWVQIRPVVAFDPAQDEKPKWVLLASDDVMTQTVRYCRQFFAASVAGAYHWGCSAWAVGVDAYGFDIVRGLENGTTYYWQVVSTDANGAEVKSEVRGFAIDPMPTSQNPTAISDQVWGTVMGDGTNLNTGTAAFVNSGLKVTDIASVRVKRYRFRIVVKYEGGVDLSRSYVRIKSRAGTRYIPTTTYGTNRARAVWTLSTRERRLRSKRFTYQALMKSTKNGAMVRSPVTVLVIRSR